MENVILFFDSPPFEEASVILTADNILKINSEKFKDIFIDGKSYKEQEHNFAPNNRAYTLTEKLAQLLNYHSMEQFSDTPDFVLAEYMMDCFRAWNKGIEAREKWYGRPINTKDSGNG